MIDGRTLEVLVAVADQLSFTKAGPIVHLTQPAVSRQISALEHQLGVKLFIRTKSGVTITEPGAVAAEQARHIIALTSHLERRMSAFSSLDAGHVRLAAFPSANVWFVPEAVRRATTLHPHIDIRLVTTGAKSGVQAVHDGDVDLALITEWDLPATKNAVVDTVPILNDPLYLAFSRSHSLADEPKIRMADLRNETWVEGSHPDCLGPLEQLATRIGAEPIVGHQCDDWNGKQAFVAANLGIMLFPGLARPLLHEQLVLVDPQPPLPPRRILAAALDHTSLPPAAAAMMRSILELAAELD